MLEVPKTLAMVTCKTMAIHARVLDLGRAGARSPVDGFEARDDYGYLHGTPR